MLPAVYKYGSPYLSIPAEGRLGSRKERATSDQKTPFRQDMGQLYIGVVETLASGFG